jgi:hypothetical protein
MPSYGRVTVRRRIGRNRYQTVSYTQEEYARHNRLNILLLPFKIVGWVLLLCLKIVAAILKPGPRRRRRR